MTLKLNIKINKSLSLYIQYIYLNCIQTTTKNSITYQANAKTMTTRTTKMLQKKSQKKGKSIKHLTQTKS